MSGFCWPKAEKVFGTWFCGGWAVEKPRELFEVGPKKIVLTNGAPGVVSGDGF
jgi:hypothetical protein